MTWPANVSRNLLYTPVNRYRTRLLAAISADETAIPIVDTSNRLPSSGVVTLGDEIVWYAGRAPNLLVGCIRGYEGTTATSHVAGAALEVRWTAGSHNVIAELLHDVVTALGTDLLIEPTPSMVPLAMISSGFGTPGFPPVGFGYPTIIILGSAGSYIDAYAEFNQPFTMDPAAFNSSGCTLTSGPVQEAGNTRARWQFQVDSDYCQISLLASDSPYGPGFAFATVPGDEFPPLSTEQSLVILMFGPLDPVDPTVNENDFVTLAPTPVPSFSESFVGTVEWYKDGVPTGVMTWTYSIPNAAVSDNGSYELWVNGNSWSTLGLGGPTTLTVTPAPGVAPTMVRNTSIYGGDGTIGDPYVWSLFFGPGLIHTFVATGDSPITFSADDLPSGMTLDSSTGELSGTIDGMSTPTPITITATNGAGSDSMVFYIYYLAPT